MPESLPESLKQKLSDRLSFYEDIGVGQFYRDRGGIGPSQQQMARAAREFTQAVEEPSLPKKESKPVPSAAPAPSRKLELPHVDSGPSLFEVTSKIENDTLLKIREDLGDCKRCKLHKTRHSIVFGDGNPKAQLVFVGEGPGADEDAQGLPFVGRAGKLLTQMIEAMGLQRKDVYICNVVKCRPPQNRQPEKDEVAECSPFLFRQIDTIAPKVVVCLGATAAKTILQTERGISQFRGEWLEFRGRKLMVTYHPAYLLRNPAAKSDVWKDLQKVMAELGLTVKRKPS
ncbi:MAG TPA: uracil-DNA glycosylase [Candidatus Dormibacteraeota bacterium]|jgi:uracil-DNA glycosylase family 4|nr:uracil-DNA glycosylase [Candidatus Dormibacteraeota bacterium]